jgi:tetratricopeptide (TPR) repeat protein
MNRILVLILILLGTSCREYLDAKPDKKLLVPSTVQDLQSLLDNDLLVNQRSPRAAEMSADDYYLTDANLAALTEFDRRMYTWGGSNLFQPGSINDWGNAYQIVNIANVVLANVDRINRTSGDEERWRQVKGHALFVRAQAFLQITFIWTVAYDQSTANTDLGIPLRLDPDFNQPTTRSSLKQTYNQIISDLRAAAELLPDMPVHALRPSKAGVYALLARVYLSMRDYPAMGEYAKQCLQIKNTLKDFNTLNQNAPASFVFAPRFSNEDEIISESSMMSTSALHQSMARIDSALYASFSENDLRKKMLFKSNSDNTYGFRGSYSGSATLFSGLATNEVYLMRAEFYARSGNVSAAMADLNKLLEKRFVTNTFVPLVASSPGEALSLILKERRKELMMRGLRWMDVKRLNKEGASIRLERLINKKSYVLLPNDPRYALPIPEDVISISGIRQNPA